MKAFKFIFVGFVFGVTMYKSEAASWFRIYEMFKFQSFHMYGMLITAIVVGVAIVWVMKKGWIKRQDGEVIHLNDKAKSIPRYLIGGIIFGLGWALGGVCPGPMFVLIGAGYSVFAVFLGAALFGTFMYGVLRPYLPH